MNNNKNRFISIENLDISNKNIDIAIIGCGISGLYTAYRLLQEYKDKNIKIVIYEKDNRIGGRCMTIKWHDRYINLGAGIFTSEHIHLIKLLETLNIEINTFNSNFECKQIEDISLYNENVKNLCELFLKVIKENDIVIRSENITFRQFINIYFDKDIHEFCDNYLFFHDIYERNLYELLPMITNNSIFYSNKNYTSHSIKNGGWQLLVDKLHLLIKDNVDIRLENKIYQIEYQSNHYIVNDNRFDIVYVCGDIDVRNIKFKNIDVSFLNVISSIPLLRIYCYNENGEFDKQSYFIPNDRKIIGINKHIQMSCYKDSQLVYDYIYELNKKMGFGPTIRYDIFEYDIIKDKISPELDKVLKEEYDSKYNKDNKDNKDSQDSQDSQNINDSKYSKSISDTLFKYWKNGVHVRRDYTQLNYPISKPNIYFLGEMMSDVLGFVEGAIKSVDLHFENTK